MTENDQGYNRVCLAEVQVDAKKNIRTESLVFAGIRFARGRWRKEMTLLEFTRMPFELYRSNEPLPVEPLADIGEASTTSPSVSLWVSWSSAPLGFVRLDLT